MIKLTDTSPCFKHAFERNEGYLTRPIVFGETLYDRPRSRLHLASQLWCFGLLGWLFIDANDLPVSLAAKLDFAGPSVETLNAYRR
jgi:hypothetical protein